jgi:hypothetical protein
MHNIRFIAQVAPVVDPPKSISNSADNLAVPVGGGLILAPFIWFFLNKGWEYLQARRKMEEKRQDVEINNADSIFDSSLANKDVLLNQVLQQNKALVEGYLAKTNEILESIEESLKQQASTQLMMSEAIKFNSESAQNNAVEIRNLLTSINTVTTKYISEAFNTQTRMFVDVTNNQTNHQSETIRLLLKLHDRLDKHFGKDQDA